MKKAVLISSLILSSTFGLSAGELEDLRSSNAEQKRQITSLEKEINNLYSLLDKELRTNGKPVKTRTSTKKVTKTTSPYTVVKGDSLSKIARTHNVALNTLMVRNNLGSNSILNIGQKLVIPASTQKCHQVTEASQLPNLPLIPKAKVEKSHSPSLSTKSYKVRKGDTFYSVAKMHSVTISELTKANPRVSPSSLSIGQTLALPSKSTAVKVAAVKKPAPIAKKPAPIAKKKVPVTSKSIASIPQKKKIETVSLTPEPVEMKPISLTSPMTLEELASKHGTTVEALNALNGWSFRPSIKLARGSEVYLPN